MPVAEQWYVFPANVPDHTDRITYKLTGWTELGKTNAQMDGMKVRAHGHVMPCSCARQEGARIRAMAVHASAGLRAGAFGGLPAAQANCPSSKLRGDCTPPANQDSNVYL